MKNKLIKIIIFSSVLSLAIFNSSLAANPPAGLQNQINRFGLKDVDVPGDGYCQYHAIAHQLLNKDYTHINGKKINYRYITQIADQNIARNPELYPGLDLEYRDHQGNEFTAPALARELNMRVVIIPENRDPEIYTPENYTETLIIGYAGNGRDGHYWSLVGQPNQILQHFLEQSLINGEPLQPIENNNFALGARIEIASMPHSLQFFTQNALSITNSISAVLSQRSSNLSISAAGEETKESNGIWIHGLGGISSDTSIPGVKAKTNFTGYAIGYETPITDQMLLGSSINIIDNTTKYALKEKAASKSYVGTLYAITNINNILFNSAIFFGKGNIKSTRQIAVQSLSGHAKTKIYGAIGELGYKFENSEHAFIPSVSLQYIIVNQSQYNETVGDRAQSYSKRAGRMLEGDIAAKYQYTTQTGQFLLLPSIKVGAARNIQFKLNDLKYKLADGRDSAYPIKANRNQQTRFFAIPEIMLKSNNFDFAFNYKIEKDSEYTGHLFGAKLMAKF